MNRAIGFDRANCLTASVDLSRMEYSPERGLAFQAALLDRLRTAPGVASATLTSHVPMGDDGEGNTQDISIPGYVPAKGEEMSVITDFEGPDFFRIIGIALRQGREFDINDTASSTPVAVVNETMAQHYWPKGTAIGSNIVVDKVSYHVVGIVSEYSYSTPSMTDHLPLLFLPLAQQYNSSVIVALRSRTTPSAITAQLRQAVASLDSGLPLENVHTLEEVTGSAIRYPAFQLNCSASMPSPACWSLCWGSTRLWRTP